MYLDFNFYSEFFQIILTLPVVEIILPKKTLPVAYGSLSFI